MDAILHFVQLISVLEYYPTMGSLTLPARFDVSTGFYNTINGKLASTKTTRHGINPATGKSNPEVPVSTQEDVDSAVAAATEAFKTWSKTPWGDRKQAILDFADALEKYTDDFANMLTLEQGKPVESSIPPLISL